MLAPSFGPRPVAYVPDFTPSNWSGPIPVGPGQSHPGQSHPGFNPSLNGNFPNPNPMPHMAQQH